MCNVFSSHRGESVSLGGDPPTFSEDLPGHRGGGKDLKKSLTSKKYRNQPLIGRYQQYQENYQRCIEGGERYIETNPPSAELLSTREQVRDNMTKAMTLHVEILDIFLQLAKTERANMETISERVNGSRL